VFSHHVFTSSDDVVLQIAVLCPEGQQPCETSSGLTGSVAVVQCLTLLDCQARTALAQASGDNHSINLASVSLSAVWTCYLSYFAFAAVTPSTPTTLPGVQPPEHIPNILVTLVGSSTVQIPVGYRYM